MGVFFLHFRLKMEKQGGVFIQAIVDTPNENALKSELLQKVCSGWKKVNSVLSDSSGYVKVEPSQLHGIPGLISQP